MLKRGLLERKSNLDKKGSADSWYFSILVKNASGDYETLLFTEEDLTRSRERVRMNPEDETNPTLFDKIVKILGKQQPIQLPDNHSEK
mgnify:CR=1 FL=1|tara:strand:- start:1953 stop:2216 length:264 start_codon:yes stop_codon:yes gene_type:complete